METENIQTPVQVQVQPVENPGFFVLLKASLQILKQNWKHFVKMTLGLLIPALVLGGLIFLVAMGFQNKAHAAPSIPTQITDNTVTADKNTPTPVTDTIPPSTGANAPVNETATTPSPDATIPETVTTTKTGSSAPAATVSTDNSTTIQAQAIINTVEKMTGTKLTGNSQTNPSLLLNSGLSAIPLQSGLLKGFGIFMGARLVVFLLSILFIIYALVSTLAMIRLTVLVVQGGEIKIWGIIKWAFTKIGSYLMLSLRILFYVSWPTLLIMIGIMIVYTITSFVSSSGALYGFVNNAFAQSASFFNDPAPNVAAQSTTGSNIIIIINYLLGLLGLLSILLIVYRAPKCIFAKFILAEKECSSKEAFQSSIVTATGHWWKIVGYSFLLGLIISICSGILVGIFSKISQPLGSVVSTLISIVGGYVAIIFSYALYNLCKMLNEKKTA
jgi:hypothetical protein